MFSFLLPILASNASVMWYLFPLSLVISLVYNASRYELPEKILQRAARHLVMILSFMGVVFILLLLLSYRL